MIRALILLVVLVLLAVAAGGLVNARTDLVAQQDQIHSEWPKVAEALKRRAELIENLATIVNAAAPAPDPIFDDIARARTAISASLSTQQQIQGAAQLMQVFAQLMQLASRIPKLKLNRDYRRATDELKEAENAVAIERRKYNEMLEHYNAQLRRFPDNIAARLSGLSRIDAYVITEQEVH